MKDIIEKLQQLDIPRREGEVYLALLQKKEFTAPEIAKITSVSRTKSYEILQNLVKKGLCNESYRNGVKIFSCVDPKIVMESILFDYEEKKRVAEQLQTNLTELYKLNGKVNENLDYIEVISDIGQIRERWLKIMRNTKNEITMFNKPPYSISFENNFDEISHLKKKIKFKCLYEFSEIKTNEERDEFVSLIERYKIEDEEIKLIKNLPMKLVISDEKATLFSLNDRISLKETFTAMVINHPNFAIALKKVFDAYWASAISVEDFKKTNLIHG